ncbi:MAG: hypothetical protein ACOX22_08305 [Caldicoprobacterales bacterium]
MKFAVGYQLSGEDFSFIDTIDPYISRIAEVYFPWMDSASGRAVMTRRRGYTNWHAQHILEHDLRELKKRGILLDLLFNSNCYGENAISQHLENSVNSVLDYLDDLVGGVDIVTTASPAVAHIVKSREGRPVRVRASVNMRIGTVKGMQYTAHLFDEYYIQREYNRDLKRIEELDKWAAANGKRLYMLVNSGCLNFCSGQTFHDNMVAHEEQIDEKQNIKAFQPHMCWNYLKDENNWVSLLQNSWIRPEDLHNYKPWFHVVKLATRMHDSMERVIDAYCSGKFYGNLLTLFEPGFARVIYPKYIDNTRFPLDWFEKTSSCSKNCHECDYCRSVLNEVLRD